jgi:ABC-type Fe3+-hydroxamate transport system substrate-binding protein
MPEYRDQMGRLVEVPGLPQRVVSLVPSLTELICDLGLSHLLAGITKFCCRPEVVSRSVKKVGGTKQVDYSAIASINPDLIICNKEENEREMVEYLSSLYPVWVTDVNDLPEAMVMIADVGRVLGNSTAAAGINREIVRNFALLGQQRKVVPELSVCYFIWKDPYMVAGKATFIDEMLGMCGFTNAFSDSRYPVVSGEEIRSAQPDLIFLSSEPYPFREKHLAEFAALCPSSKVLLVDGELFSWYGSRLRRSPAYFGELLKTIASG